VDEVIACADEVIKLQKKMARDAGIKFKNFFRFRTYIRFVSELRIDSRKLS
jgi:transcription initiation factor TFIIIB Brf1 subunit/transcription initiation factor TFIIB